LQAVALKPQRLHAGREVGEVLVGLAEGDGDSAEEGARPCAVDRQHVYGVRVDESTRYAPKFVTYFFCRETCKQYWLNSTRDLYNLPPGMRLSVQ